MEQNKFIFLDARGSRWRYFRFFLAGGMLLVFICLVLFIKSLIVTPRLSHLQQEHTLLRDLKAKIDLPEKPAAPKLPPDWARAGTGKPAPAIKPSSAKEPPKNIRLAFYTGSDEYALSSLQRNASKLTHVAPEWFFLSGVPAVLGSKQDKDVLDFADDNDLAFMPMLTNLNGTWQPEAIETLASADPERQRQIAQQLASELKKLDAEGVVLDWEEVDSAYRDAVTALISTIAGVLHDQELQLWLCIPVGNDLKVYDLDSLAGEVDRFVAMLYDENGDTDEAGPIASHEWFREWLSVLLDHGEKGQWVIGIGVYGYEWKAGETAKTIRFADSMARACHAGEGPIENNPKGGPNFTYTAQDQLYTVWFLDAATFYNQKKMAEAKGTEGIALYRLGLEDPAIWQMLESGVSCKPADFEAIKTTETIAHIGDGDFLMPLNERADGRRSITVDDAGLWRERYESYPRNPLLYHQGESAPDSVAITFDDGPDPEWTPRILDILKDTGVQAAFFVTGINAERYPDIIKRILAEGHELGNHTYNHADMTGMSAALEGLDLNAAQRIIEGITGRSTVLFRPPYNADRRPRTLEEYSTILIADELGYVTVSASIDAEDWDESEPAVILQRVRERRSEGNVLLLHDAGGDRENTVAALPSIIDYLRRRGDHLVGLHSLIGVPMESLMPPIPSSDPQQELFIAHNGFYLMHLVEEFGWAFMIVTTALLVVRMIVLLALAIRHRTRGQLVSSCPAGAPEPVSVLIAAYNEEKVIGATLASVLAADYKGDIEVIVVDDGSTDATASLVAQAALKDHRVKLIRQENGGKAGALNTALQSSAHELLVMLDADTQFTPHTIGSLVAPLADTDVGAVSGHARVGNDNRWITRFQSLEYTCGFNLDRRAYDERNCVTVVPGAVSAFRKSAILQAGGLSLETIAEDTDLTLMLHRLGYKVCYAPQAVAFTEAPDTVAGLVRQRSRWAFGTLQCLFKHSDLLFNPKFRWLAFFSLPSIWFFHFFLIALIPVVDTLLLFSLITGSGLAIVDYALVFLLMDVAIALAACLMEGEPLRRAWLILPMRFLYRPILSWAVWKAIVRALRGTLVAWGRQDRRGSVLPAK